jgi:hypothetical protein
MTDQDADLLACVIAISAASWLDWLWRQLSPTLTYPEWLWQR